MDYELRHRRQVLLQVTVAVLLDHFIQVCSANCVPPFVKIRSRVLSRVIGGCFAYLDHSYNP